MTDNMDIDDFDIPDIEELINESNQEQSINKSIDFYVLKMTKNSNLRYLEAVLLKLISELFIIH